MQDKDCSMLLLLIKFIFKESQILGMKISHDRRGIIRYRRRASIILVIRVIHDAQA